MFKGLKFLDNSSITFIIKVAILGLLIWALYAQLIQAGRLADITKELSAHQDGGFWLWLILASLLMFVNWGLEASKWMLLVNALYTIPFVRAFKAVWTGVTLGLFTPNRVGEYGGRLLYIPNKFRLSVIVSTLIGSFSQILSTLLLGAVALILFLNQHMGLTGISCTIVSVITGLLLSLLILAYYQLPLVVDLFKNRRFLRRIVPYIEVLSRYNTARYSQVLLLSILRFLVFSAQYLILLRLFGVHLHIGEGAIVVFVIFLAQTVLPSFTVAELFTRGNISLYFLKYYTDNSGAILAASTSLWLLNLIIPAVLGYFFILRKNFFKTRNQ